jgi:hypothetical protein
MMMKILKFQSWTLLFIYCFLFTGSLFSQLNYIKVQGAHFVLDQIQWKKKK